MFDSWPSIQIGSWQAFVNHATEHVESGSRFVYRGQADSDWDLRSTLLRSVTHGTPASQALTSESICLAEFKAQAHLHLAAEQLPGGTAGFDASTPFDWWPIMQHFGAPTRLLDWTYSPFVAAYFAIEQQPNREGVVFLVDTAAVTQHLNQTLEDPTPARIWEIASREDAPDAVGFYHQTRWRSSRAVAQQAIPSFSLNVCGTNESLRDICLRHGKVKPGFEPARRWLFSPAVKAQMLRHLRTANITAQSLFPGLDGLGRSIKEIVRIRDAAERRRQLGGNDS